MRINDAFKTVAVWESVHATTAAWKSSIY